MKLIRNMEFNSQIIDNTKENVIEYLNNIVNDYDNDFNGNNGEDYLLQVAKDEGFKTNIDYSINKVMKQYEIDNNIVKAIEDFFDIWFNSDDSYYDEYDYCVYEYKDKLFISFVFMGAY